MPRKYVRKPGARNYKDYLNDTLEEAIAKVKSGEISMLKASKNYGIPFGTLHNRVKEKHTKKSGGQTIFTEVEELALIQGVTTCADWGYPPTILDLQMFTQFYLNSNKRNVTQFKNNLPGVDWAYSMLCRHKSELCQRLSSNITRARAKVSDATLKTYFDNLEVTIDGVPPENIFNYDESNLSDDPGKVKGLYTRGVKYPEKVMNHSKSATSIMVCGSASGVLLPPYVVYRSKHMWDTWIERGPKGKPCCNEKCCARGSRYNSTSHGWMEAACFTDWFKEAFLPHAVRLPGRKVVIGDNLASHFTDEVLALCNAHDIAFVCLPSSSTHICQPLDVSFFRPMKTAWRIVLTEWKVQNSKACAVPKEIFPSLLRKVLEKMDIVEGPDKETNGIERNVKSGFEATGIFPFDSTRVLKRLPSIAEVQENVNVSLTTFLKEKRYGDGKTTNVRKKTRIAVEPGKSVNAVDDSTSDSEPEVLTLFDSDGEEIEPQEEENSEEEDTHYIDPATVEKIEVGNYVLVKFMSGRRNATAFRYVCIVQECISDPSKEDYVLLGLKSADSTKKSFIVVDDDISTVEKGDILAILPNPNVINKRDHVYHTFDFQVDIKEK